jgi:FMN reductase
MSHRKPLIVGLGGTTRPGSSSEQALTQALDFVCAAGAETQLFSGRDLLLPLYDPEPGTLTEAAQKLLTALREADGIVLSSPCYHGALSGLIKNAIDYTEEMRGDARPYFDGRAVGCIGCGYGYQGPGMVLGQLRAITHALRGWPVPLGVAINSAVIKFEGGKCSDSGIAKQLEIMAHQVVEFATHQIRSAHPMRS